MPCTYVTLRGIELYKVMNLLALYTYISSVRRASLLAKGFNDAIVTVDIAFANSYQKGKRLYSISSSDRLPSSFTVIAVDKACLSFPASFDSSAA